MCITRIRRERKGRAKMAKDMSKTYSEMLTKELVALRKRHIATLEREANINSRAARERAERAANLIDQINAELASRVAQFNLFV